MPSFPIHETRESTHAPPLRSLHFQHQPKVEFRAHASFDKQTVKHLKDIEHLSEDDRKTLSAMIDAFLRDAKARKAYTS